jgi:hypothetical protein
MASDPKLTPCKCSECGRPARGCRDDLGYYVKCSMDFCNNTTEYFDTPEQAIAAWNHRNGEEAPNGRA